MGLPGERTIFIEVKPELQADGIPNQSQLDSAREYITRDPITGKTREVLGNVEELLRVEPIWRTSFYVEVRGLVIPNDRKASAKSAIADETDRYFRSISPFVDGVDVVSERTDTITSLTVIERVQKVLQAFGGYATGIGFGTTEGSFLSEYTLGQGEKAKLIDSGVTYA